MAWLTLGVFAAVLLICIATGGPLLLALAVGLVLFLLYGRRAGFSWRELGRMCLDGIKTVRNILITFVLIGILTAFWRASGTIPAIVCYASSLIRPSILLLMTFLLNCLVSVLTGTAFGTGATMGVICATMAASLGLDVRLVGGAILAGVYFGDRCSPVSTSALLVAELTGTSIYSNIHRMVRTALVPFLGSCGIYLVLGFTQNAGGDLPDLRTLFARVFVLHWAALAPAVVILVLSVLQINVKIAMSASILTALPLCLFLQHVPVPDLLKMVFTGYQTPDAQVGVMMNGGGIFSMVRVAGIVCLLGLLRDLSEDRASGRTEARH